MLKLRRFPLVAVLMLAVTAAACGDDDPTDVDDGDDGDPTATVFTFTPPAGTTVTSVSVPGTFNEWSTTANPMTEQTDGSWQASVLIPAGTIEYKFFINELWPQNMCSDATWGDPAAGGRIDPESGPCVDDENNGMNATRVIS